MKLNNDQLNRSQTIGWGFKTLQWIQPLFAHKE